MKVLVLCSIVLVFSYTSKAQFSTQQTGGTCLQYQCNVHAPGGSIISSFSASSNQSSSDVGGGYYITCNCSQNSPLIINTFVNNPNEKVGIGTSSPETKLHVVGDIKTTGFIMEGGAGEGKVLMSSLHGVASWANLPSSQWTTNSSSIYYNTGKVGIGIDNPIKTLHINTPTNDNGIVIQSGVERLFFSNLSNGSWNIDSYGTSGTRKDIVFQPNGGNVGIGITSALAKLHVNPNGAGGILVGGGVTGNTQLALYVSQLSDGWAEISSVNKHNQAWGNLILNRNGGNVGIGTGSSPSAQLHLADVYGAGGRNLQIGDDTYFTDIDQANILGLYGTSGNGAGLKLGNNGPTLFGGNNGSFGIGTTNPETKVDIINGDDIGLRVRNINGNGISIGVKYQLNYPIWPASQYDSYIYAHQTVPNTTGGNLAIANASNGKSIKFITTRGPSDLNAGNQGVAMEILSSGQVIIYEKNFTGIKKASSTSSLLSVDGEIHARKVVVTNAFADYVFNNDYKLLSLEDLEKIIKETHKLPNIPSAFDIEKNGLDAGEILRLQMEKIEELTLYILQLNKDIRDLKMVINK